jgi:hypothetical protein
VEEEEEEGRYGNNRLQKSTADAEDEGADLGDVSMQLNK